MNQTIQKVNSRTRCERSLFRGVAKNGNTGWQIMLMIRGHQNYIGTVDNVNMAALMYDIISIQLFGLSVKTNFNYTVFDLIAILSIE